MGRDRMGPRGAGIEAVRALARPAAARGAGCMLAALLSACGGIPANSDAALVAWLRTGAKLSCELAQADAASPPMPAAQVLAQQQWQAHASQYPEQQGMMRALSQDVRSLVLQQGTHGELDCGVLASSRKVERLIDKALRRPMMEPAPGQAGQVRG